MKFRDSGCLRQSFSYFFSFAVLLCVHGSLHAQTVPLQRMIELALAHSTVSLSAQADVQRAMASYLELHNNYIPQVTVGSGLGYSYGFPLTLEGAAPSLANVVVQNSIINPAQREFIRAAKTEWQAAQFQDKDQRNAIIQDVSISYAELVKWQIRLKRLQTAESQALAMETAVTERIQAGVDSLMDLNRAKLVSARVRLHIAEARGAQDALQRHLAHLTGLPLASVQIDPQSIPPIPALDTEEDLTGKALASNPALKAADQHAIAQAFRATGEHRALLPTIDFAAQYARLASFNNYDVYYRSFQPNNMTVGISARFPFFNAPQRARARAAAAEAVKAKEQAEAARNQVSEDTAKLQRAVEQLAAARDVAQLDYELAQSAFEAAQTKANAGTGTLHDVADARAQANEKFLTFQDADFEYERARLNLMRSTGDLEKWAMGSQK